MKILWLLPLALPLIAAAPPRRLTMTVPSNSFGSQTAPQASATPSRYQPAPLPNRNFDGPASAGGPASPSLSPTMFTRSEQFRGDGYVSHSTAQVSEEHNFKPSVGFKLQVPLTPQ